MAQPTKITIREASKQFNIYPRTRKALKAWDIADIKRRYIDRRLVMTADGIKWAIGTGRLPGGVEIAIRQMSTYQTLRLLVDVANNINTMNDVPGYLNQNQKTRI